MPENRPSPAEMPATLRNRAEFLAVQRGERRHGKYFLLEVLDRGLEVPPRTGITVSRRQGNAVERNRIRRRLHEAIRADAAGDMKPGCDYVIVGRREILSVPFSKLKAELSRRIAGKSRD